MVAKPPVLQLIVALGVVLASVPAGADTNYFGGGGDPTEVKYRRPKSRTLGQQLTIAGFTAGGLLAGGVGVYFHLDSRDAASELSSDGRVMGAWTADRQAQFDRAGSSGTKAIIGYSVGAVLLGAAVVALWRSVPGDEEVAIEPARKAAVPVIAPVAGGAVVGGAWSW